MSKSENINRTTLARVRYAGGKLRAAAWRRVAEVRPGQIWGLPVAFAARTTIIHQIQQCFFDMGTICRESYAGCPAGEAFEVDRRPEYFVYSQHSGGFLRKF